MQGLADPHAGVVGLVFTDIEGSTRLLGELGTDRYGELLTQHHRVCREAWAAHGGHEVGTEGDAFFVVFAAASSAVLAAAQAQRGLARLNLRVRMGVHAGEVSVQETGYVGMEVHRAARIAASGHGEQVVVSAVAAAAAAGLVDGLDFRSLGDHRLKDLSEAQGLFQLCGQGLRESFPPLKSLGGYSTNLPTQPSPLLGRERDLAALVGLVAAHRLVTLTGPGGTGKTRLALQAGAEALDRFRDGVFFCDLAPLRDSELVAATILQAIGLREQPGEMSEQALVRYVGDKRLLLVLDNFEQLLAAATLITRVLKACPNLRLIVTSRAPLRVEAEWEFPVESLSLPDAVALFEERAARVGHETGEHRLARQTTEEICVRLDRLPLGIELAAARMRSLTPEQLLTRLQQRLTLLTGGRRDAPDRQRTLRASIEWSYELLATEEQLVLARLSVFASGCTDEAAAAICRADLDTLQALTENSLLQRTGDRFWLLETIREFARERLAQQEDVGDDTQRLFADYLIVLAETAQPQLRGPEQEVWFRSLLAEQDNFRAALGWAVAQEESVIALRLAGALEVFWRRRGQYEEGARWFNSVLALAPPPLPEQRARALASGAHLSALVGNFDVAEQRYAESIGTLRELGDDAGLAEALRGFAELAAERGQTAQAQAAAEEALELFMALNDRGAMAGRLRFLGELALERHYVGSARDLLGRAIAVAREAGDGRNVVRITHSLADLELSAGHPDQAEVLYRSALVASRETPHESVTAHCLLGLAAVAAARGKAEEAGMLWSAGERLADRLGMRIDPSADAHYAQVLDVLDPQAAERFATARAVAATSHSIEEAIESVH